MEIGTTTIDQIVAGVLAQLATDGEGVALRKPKHDHVSREVTTNVAARQGIVLADRVITAEVVSAAVSGDSRLIVVKQAIVTPAAWDIAREKGIEIVRDNAASAVHLNREAKSATANDVSSSLVIVVRNTETVERLRDDLKLTWWREVLDCPDDAAALAVSAICRRETPTAVILTEQFHRAACLSNRNDRIKAVAIQDVGDIRSVKQQLQANVWCLDPSNRSWFELRNLIQAITAG